MSIISVAIMSNGRRADGIFLPTQIITGLSSVEYFGFIDCTLSFFFRKKVAKNAIDRFLLIAFLKLKMIKYNVILEHNTRVARHRLWVRKFYYFSYKNYNIQYYIIFEKKLVDL